MSNRDYRTEPQNNVRLVRKGRWQIREQLPWLSEHYVKEGLWTTGTMADLLEERGSHLRDLPFRVYSESHAYRGTVGDVLDLAKRFATTLGTLGLEPGDVVVIQLPNWMEAAAAFWGTLWFGAVCVPVVHFYGRKELAYILQDSGAKALVTASNFRHLNYLSNLDSLRQQAPDLQHIFVVGEPAPGTTPFETAFGARALDEPSAVDPADPAIIAYTSGTTADPKGVIHSHQTTLSGVSMPLNSADPRPGLVGTPVGHVTGMTHALILPIVTGKPIHMIDVWAPERVLELMLNENLVFSGGPTYFVTSLLDSPSFTKAHLDHIRYVGMGGSKIPRAVADRLRDLGCVVKRVYGSSETLTATASDWNDPESKRLYTDGRAMNGTELRIVDEEGNELPCGREGEIWVRSPRLFLGYTNAALTAHTMTSEGWYRTGDVGALDEDGYLTITDRIQDIIIRGGENISSTEVEDQLLRMPGVQDVAVISTPDERFGERVCACIVTSSTAPPPSLETIHAFLAQRGLARPKWPEQLQLFQSDLPRTASGKVRKFELRQLIAAQET